MYQIELGLTENDTVTSFRCSCPYEYGEVCKHIVAVLYELRERPEIEPEGIDPDEEAAFLEGTLEGLTREELTALIREKAVIDQAWRALILTRYSESEEKTQSARYDNILKDAISIATDRQGYIGYREADIVADGALALLREADAFLARRDYRKGLLIIRSVIVKCATRSVMHEVAGILRNRGQDSAESARKTICST